MNDVTSSSVIRPKAASKRALAALLSSSNTFVRDLFKDVTPKVQRTRGVEPELSENEKGGRLETLSDRFSKRIDVEGEEIADVLL